MNTIFKAALLSTALTLPILSGIAYGHQQGSQSGGMMMTPEKTNQHMMQMREQMQESHALIEKIMAEENVEKREKMLQEHMQSMRQQMQGMNKWMDDELMSGSPSQDMDERMRVMNMRMNMMQMMMEQMMEYQDQAQ